MLHFTSKCTKNAFGGQALPGPAGGACNAPADPLAELQGREWEGSEEEKERRGPALYEVR